MEENNIKLKEHDIMLDVGMSQNFIANEYSSAVLDAETPQIKKAFSAVLSDEQEISAEISEILTSRGWQKAKDAEKSEICKIKEQFTQKN